MIHYIQDKSLIPQIKIGVECIKWNKKSGEELTFTAAQIMINPKTPPKTISKS